MDVWDVLKIILAVLVVTLIVYHWLSNIGPKDETTGTAWLTIIMVAVIILMIPLAVDFYEWIGHWAGWY